MDSMAPARDFAQQKHGGIVAPMARKCSPTSSSSSSSSSCRQVEPSQSESCQRSRLTSSLQAMATGGEQLGELELILQGQPPDAPHTYLGISPPVRSGCYGGACNPIEHDSSWSNLQALRELDSQHSFLRSLNGDFRLLIGSPDLRAALAEEVSQPVQAQQQDRNLLPFTCRAQYFAVR